MYAGSQRSDHDEMETLSTQEGSIVDDEELLQANTFPVYTPMPREVLVFGQQQTEEMLCEKDNFTGPEYDVTNLEDEVFLTEEEMKARNQKVNLVAYISR